MRRWSSGRMLACHARDPGPIPGRRTLFLSLHITHHTHYTSVAGLNTRRKATLEVFGFILEIVKIWIDMAKYAILSNITKICSELSLVRNLIKCLEKVLFTRNQ
ncbi:Conserved_hypothetical protein [Hexamita inflata]|uniref:Uncharacterized protein n=1 Tax=Hexamita inflata TaxID=28002 RepID=A0AA86UEH0_9EUKA|nr:Conserved hypothetical protein [Hexamita inflata]